jgi:hypothetical protein
VAQAGCVHSLLKSLRYDQVNVIVRETIRRHSWVWPA